MCLAVARAYAE